MGAQEDAKKGSQNTEMRIGTWNVQALGWGLLQLLLGAACTGCIIYRWGVIIALHAPICALARSRKDLNKKKFCCCCMIHFYFDSLTGILSKISDL